MIPQERLYRLLRNILGETYDAKQFSFQAGEGGFSYYPTLDIEDIATLARIASGEDWEPDPLAFLNKSVVQK